MYNKNFMIVNYMGLQKYILQNNKTIAMIIYIALFIGIVVAKPIFIFNEDGSVKEFGLSNMKKTILPLWLIIVVIAILSYMSVLYYLAYGFRRF